jgi:glycosyltransferase involved in cell wall biosynthesis
MNTVSIIITAYNRARQLADVLASVLLLETDGTYRYEVVVVDNNSTDTTRNVVEDYIPKFTAEVTKDKCLGLKYIFEPKQGKPYALNRGLAEIRGVFIFFTDDDVTVDPQWLISMMNCFQQTRCDGIGGRVLPVYPQNTPDWIKGDHNKMSGIVVVYDYGKETRRYDSSMDEFIGANYAFKKQVFEDCGLFRTEFSRSKVPVGEDREFISRVIRNKKVLYYCGQAVVHHPVDLNRAKFKNIARWNIALGRSAALREREEGQAFKYIGGVPRYLWRGIVLDFLWILPSVFSRRALFFSLRRFFRKVGMIREYRARKL